MLSLNTKVKHNPRVIKKILKGKVYIFTAKSLNLHNFNELASFIWLTAKKPTSIKQIVKKIIKEFKINEETALKDTKEFVSYCLKNKFLSVVKT